MDDAYTLITDPATLDSAVTTLGRAPLLAIDTETTGLDPHRDRMRLLTLASEGCTALLDTWRVPGWQDRTRRLFADPARIVVAHHAGFDLRFLLAAGIEVDAAVHDTLVMAQLLDGGVAYEDRSEEHPAGVRRSYALAAVAERALGIALDKEQQTSDWGADMLAEEQLRYAARDARVLLPLHAQQREALERAGLARVAAIEAACTPALAWLTHAGMPFDRQAWEALASAAEQELRTLRREIAAAVRGTGANEFGGFAFSPDSPAQVVTLLLRLGVRVAGKVSGDEATLAAWQHLHPSISLLLRYRDAAKRSQTYGREWAAAHTHPATGRVHADYRQIGAASGRMSCVHPNMQNIPRVREYRRCFRVPAGRALVKADFSGIELRVAAVIANEETMLAAFRAGADLHRRSASALLGIPEDQVTKEQRQTAKSANFGLLYGMGAPGYRLYAATTFGVRMTEQEAATLRERFFAAYPGLRRWHRRQHDGAVDIRSMTGRVRYAVGAFTQKLNTPVQSSAADGLKLALGRLWAHRSEVPSATLVATVHDEVVAECPAEDAPAVAAWLERHMVAAMEEIVAAGVPIEVEHSIAQDWAGTALVAEQGTLPPPEHGGHELQRKAGIVRPSDEPETGLLVQQRL